MNKTLPAEAARGVAAIVLSRSHARSVYFLVFAAFYLISRLSHIDSDAPPWDLALYQPVDEFWYTFTGLNLYQFGSLIHSPVPGMPGEGSALHLFLSLATAPSLFVFGNNYFGLRLPAVVFGLITLLTFLSLAWRVAHTERIGRVAAWIAAAYLVADFCFLVSNRIVEPSVVNTAAMMAVLLLASRETSAEASGFTRRAVTLGVACGLSVLWVYVYTAFVMLAVGLAILAVSARGGLAVCARNGMAYVAGIAASVLASEIILRLSFGLSVADVAADIVGIGNSVGERLPMHDTLFNLASALWSNVSVAGKQYFTHNIFRFSPGLLYAFLASLPIFAVVAWRKRSLFLLTVSFLLVARYLQNVVLPHDWFQKKMVMLLPLVLIVVLVALAHREKVEWLGITARHKLLYGAYCAFCAWLVLSGLDLPAVGRGWIDQINRIVTPLAIAAHVLFAFGPSTARLAAVPAFGVLALASNAALSATYVLLHPTFRYRDALIALAPRVNDRLLVGGVSFAVRLYNTSRPAINCYQYYRLGEDAALRGTLRLLSSGASSQAIVYTPNFNHPFRCWAAFAPAAGMYLTTTFDFGDVGGEYRLGLFELPRKLEQ